MQQTLKPNDSKEQTIDTLKQCFKLKPEMKRYTFRNNTNLHKKVNNEVLLQINLNKLRELSTKLLPNQYQHFYIRLIHPINNTLREKTKY